MTHENVEPAIGRGNALVAAVAANGVLTMSSREIAGVVRSRHDKVKQSIERLAERGVIGLPPMGEYLDSLGRPAKEYRLEKRDSFVVVAQLSPEFTALLVDRWQKLEELVASPKAPPAPIELPMQAEAFKLMPTIMRAARCIGLDKNAAAISANNALAKMTGVNVLGLLGATHLEAEKQVQFFTPTDLGARIGISARKFNMLLAEAGLQAKRGETWVALDPARDFVRMYDTGKRHGDGTPVTQMKWAENVLSLVQSVAA